MKEINEKNKEILMFIVDQLMKYDIVEAHRNVKKNYGKEMNETSLENIKSLILEIDFALKGIYW